MRKKNNHAAAVVVVLFFLLIGSMTVLFPAILNRSDMQNTAVKVPLVVTSLTSRSDGNAYTVQSIFSVVYDAKDKKTKKLLDDTDAQAVIQTIMADLDYDTIEATDGVTYINEQVSAAFNAHLGSEAAVQLYITDLLVNDVIVLTDAASNAQLERMKGLFPNMN